MDGKLLSFLDPVLYQGRAVINFGDLRGVYIKSTLVSSHPKIGEKKTMPNFTGREKLSNKNKVSLSIQVASLQLEFAIQYR